MKIIKNDKLRTRILVVVLILLGVLWIVNPIIVTTIPYGLEYSRLINPLLILVSFLIVTMLLIIQIIANKKHSHK